MSKEKWNRRYTERDTASPGEPNPTFVEEIGGLPPGRALDLAAGDGRHTLYLASRGWNVTAVDFSHVAVRRGRRFAAEAGLTEVEWIETDVTRFTPEIQSYDLAALLFLHLPWEEMQAVILAAAGAVAPNGVFFLLGHDRRNIGRGTGGPQDPEVLYTSDDVVALFSDEFWPGDTGTDGPWTIERAVAIERQPEHPGEVQSGPLSIDCLVRARRTLPAR